MGNKSEFQKILEKHLQSPDVHKTVLSKSQQSILISIARNSIKNYLESNKIPEVIYDDPSLLEHRATFVTLRTRDNDELRGCKGEIFPTKPLIVSVQQTAISTAINDPRFPSVDISELDNLVIEISVLTPIFNIKPDEIVLGKHGLIIVKGENSALLLPHVPVLYNLDKNRFLKELCNKAGLEDGSWKDKESSLYGFEAIVFSEND